jgi:hypothetical protein
MEMYDELEPSASVQLDANGMQRYAREYVEAEFNGMRCPHKVYSGGGQPIDYTDGIQFSGKP